MKKDLNWKWILLKFILILAIFSSCSKEEYTVEDSEALSISEPPICASSEEMMMCVFENYTISISTQPDGSQQVNLIYFDGQGGQTGAHYNIVKNYGNGVVHYNWKN
jgi:hypothetical protein